MKTTQPTASQQTRLNTLAKLAEQAVQARSALHQAIRQGHEEAGLRPLWMATATGLARSTIYLILDRGDRFVGLDQQTGGRDDQ